MDDRSTISIKKMQEDQQIFICRITMQPLKQPYVLPCQHTFQLEQIKKELEIKGTCPLCKSNFEFQEGAINVLAKQGISGYKNELQRKSQKNKILNSQKKQIFILKLYNNPFCLYFDKETTHCTIIKEIIEHQGLLLSVDEFQYYFYEASGLKIQHKNAEQIFEAYKSRMIEPIDPEWGSIHVDLKFRIRLPLQEKLRQSHLKRVAHKEQM